MTEPQTLRDLVDLYLGEQCTVILDAGGPLRAGENVIHTTRVAVRRLRSTLRTLPELFDVPRAGHLEDELIWWAGLLGVVRDADILAARMEARLADLPPDLVLGPVGATIVTELLARRSSGLAEVAAELDSDRYRALLADLHRWRAETPYTSEADRPVARISHFEHKAKGKVDKRLTKAAAACVARDPEADALLHGARKAGKRHRYLAELAEPVWGVKAEKIIDRRKGLQDALGGHQDSHVAATFLRELGRTYGTHDGQNGFTYGLLFQIERDLQRRTYEALFGAKPKAAEAVLLALSVE